MLSKILAIFNEEPANLCSAEICQRLGVEPSAVEGMLEMLVRVGKLVVIDANNDCSACPAHTTCFMISNARRSFALPSHTPVSSVRLQARPDLFH